jgi:dishevelled associated activator of morphogenesis
MNKFLFLVDYGSYPQHWLLFDRIVQQIVLQSEGNEANITRNPDVAPIDINVKEIVHLLAKEEELVAARKKADELEKENSDMSSRLAKKEQELDLRTQEKVQLLIYIYIYIYKNSIKKIEHLERNFA